jgi:hypothetical protein
LTADKERLSPTILRRVVLLEPLLHAYPRSGMGEKNIQVYAKALTVLSEAELKAAVLRCISVYKFFPSIAEIIEAAESVSNAMQGKQSFSSWEAWQMALSEVRRCCHVLVPEIKNAEVAEAVRLFGWSDLCAIEEQNVNTARAHFTRIYESVIARGRDKRVNQNIVSLLAKKSVAGQMTSPKVVELAPPGG